MNLVKLFSALVFSFATPIVANAATTFFFQFDNSGGGPDGSISPPLVGNGVFVSPLDLAPGTYSLSSLPGFSLNFSFGQESFSTVDIATPLGQVAIEISAVSTISERLVLVENGSPSNGGPYAGSLDIVNSNSDVVSFGSASIGHQLYFETDLSGAQSFLGNYKAVSGVPEPESWVLMVVGFGGLASLLRFPLAQSSASRRHSETQA